MIRGQSYRETVAGGLRSSSLEFSPESQVSWGFGDGDVNLSEPLLTWCLSALPVGLGGRWIVKSGLDVLNT